MLTDGHSYNVGELTLGAVDRSNITVTGWTIWKDLKSLSKERALSELKETEYLFKKMVSISPELTDFIKNREVKFCLWYDYGMGGIEICFDNGKKIEWLVRLKE